MSSPAPHPSEMDPSQFMGTPSVEPPTRPMRVKVLYSFDNDNKTNCLARLPDVLQVPVMAIDENTQIGVIELKTCIRAIVSASPELLSIMGQGDYTIYAYDYSEYGSPLVGQGMLSGMLAGVSPTPSAPAHKSSTMVTGRVCKNIMAIFSSGIQDTLEVKLRLVPVPKQVQNEYVKSMDTYRSMNVGMSGSFDTSAWAQSFEANTGLEPSFEDFSTHSFSAHNGQNQGFPQQAQRQRHMSNASMHARPVSTQPRRGMDLNSRPSSRNSTRSEHRSHQRDQSMNNVAVEQYQEDGQSRKRAKVSQTEWRGKSAFGGTRDDLRVTASTAASIRVHKPVATRPGGPGNNSLEPPPRAPTPVPQSGRSGPGRHPSQPGNFVRRESSLFNTQIADSPYEPSAYANSDAVMSSPEDDRGHPTTEFTPFDDFPSSPPIMPEPSSPGLPTLSRPADSGYMSSGAFECNPDDDDRPAEIEDIQNMSHYQQRPPMNTMRSDISFVEQTPGPPDRLPTRMINSTTTTRPKEPSVNLQADVAQQKAQSSLRRSSLALPPKQEQTVPTPSELQRSQSDAPFQRPSTYRAESIANTLPSVVGSPAPPEDFAGMNRGLARSGSGAKRKKAIQEKLMQSVASGAMPMFCAHCGAIQTPTWRSLHVKTVHGCPEEDKVADQEGVTMGLEILERNRDTKKVTKYRVIKSMRKSRDRVEMQGYETMSVCNPCGLWFNKFKFMRPPEKWNKNPKKKRQSRRDGTESDMAEPQSDYMPSVWTDQVQEDDEFAEEPERPAEAPAVARQPLIKRPRANSMQPQRPQLRGHKQWSEADLDVALHRAIQSSPARFQGTQESPIELEDELTPKPTRRLLFPSPRKIGETKSLDDSCLSKTDVPSNNNPTQPSLDDTFVIEFATATTTSDKENLPPFFEDDDEFAHLFKTPSKKTPPQKAIAHFDALLKTPETTSRRSITGSNLPTRTPNRTNTDAFLPTFSSSETKNFFPRTPSRYSATQNNNLSSPSHNTNPLANANEPLTPFSRSLTQMLSDANNQPDNSAGNGLGLGGLASFSSPGQPFDFGDLPTFLTPGRDYGCLLDFGMEEFGALPELGSGSGNGSGKSGKIEGTCQEEGDGEMEMSG